MIDAICREKQIKGWDRAKRVSLIESANPAWDDLSEGWYAANHAVDQLGADSTEKPIPRSSG